MSVNAGLFQNHPGHHRRVWDFRGLVAITAPFECVSFNKIGDGEKCFRQRDRLQISKNLQSNQTASTTGFAGSIPME